MRLAWLDSETTKTMLTVIAIPLALAYLSHRYEETTAKNQAADARLRLYTELLTSREQADSGLRKDMFGKVLDTFMTKRDGDVDQQLVELELLAANFQDSLNLSPLFRQLRRQIDAQPPKDKAALMERLESVASDVKARQIEALELVGAKMDGTVNFAQLDSGTGAPVVVDKELSFSDPGSTDAGAGGNRGSPQTPFPCGSHGVGQGSASPVGAGARRLQAMGHRGRSLRFSAGRLHAHLQHRALHGGHDLVLRRVRAAEIHLFPQLPERCKR